jgi:hypothetical protein
MKKHYKEIHEEEAPVFVVNEYGAAKALGISVGKLKTDRHFGIGCPYIKAGKRVLYSIEDIKTYLKEQTIALAPLKDTRRYKNLTTSEAFSILKRFIPDMVVGDEYATLSGYFDLSEKDALYVYRLITTHRDEITLLMANREVSVAKKAEPIDRNRKCLDRYAKIIRAYEEDA